MRLTQRRFQGSPNDHLDYAEEQLDLLASQVAQLKKARRCAYRFEKLVQCEYLLGEIFGNAEWLEGGGPRDERLADRVNKIADDLRGARWAFRKTCVR